MENMYATLMGCVRLDETIKMTEIRIYGQRLAELVQSGLSMVEAKEMVDPVLERGEYRAIAREIRRIARKGV